jgi:hypothetical protein
MLSLVRDAERLTERQALAVVQFARLLLRSVRDNCRDEIVEIARPDPANKRYILDAVVKIDIRAYVLAVKRKVAACSTTPEP